MLSHFSHVTRWIAARQAPPSVGFSRQGYWSGLPCPPPGDLPDPGIQPTSFAAPTLARGFFNTSSTWEALDKDKQASNVGTSIEGGVVQQKVSGHHAPSPRLLSDTSRSFDGWYTLSGLLAFQVGIHTLFCLTSFFRTAGAY